MPAAVKLRTDYSVDEFRRLAKVNRQRRVTVGDQPCPWPDGRCEGLEGRQSVSPAVVAGGGPGWNEPRRCALGERTDAAALGHPKSPAC
jgi:hypothetical protein